MYNFFVLLISALFSLFIFVVIGATILFSLLIVSYLSRELGLVHMDRDWTGVMKICMLLLTLIVAGWNIIAISRNIRFKRPRQNG